MTWVAEEDKSRRTAASEAGNNGHGACSEYIFYLTGNTFLDTICVKGCVT